MDYSGFADEAGLSIDKQILATKALGWKYIESRNIGLGNLSTMTDYQFGRVSGKLEKSGVKIHCFGSSIANWGRNPLREKDYRGSLKELQRALPRMEKLGVKYLRAMSFAIIKDRDPDDREIEENVFRKVGQLVRICEDHGVVYLHENCMNYGGQSYEHTLRLLDKIQSPSFRLAFDTGNPVHSWDRREMPPVKKQDSFEFYTHVKEYIDHVHIKDCIWTGSSPGVFDKAKHTFPGEGDGRVREIVRDLLRSGYDKVLSIEPHMASVFHEKGSGKVKLSRMDTYVEYGRRLMQLVEEERRALNDKK